MSGTGSIDLTARRSGARTILERVRYDGISRCSRAFAHDDAALIVLSQLGPGVVRGDQVTTRGRLHVGSRVIVTSQTATRLMGGPARASATAHWIVDDGAVLEIIGEPLIADGDADYHASTTIDLAGDARVLISDIFGVRAGARVKLRTSIRHSGLELFYDGMDAALTAPQVVGTFALVGLPAAADVAGLLATLDAVSSAHGETTAIGIGLLARGVFARVVAPDVWSVRTALLAIRAAARTYLIDPAYDAPKSSG